MDSPGLTWEQVEEQTSEFINKTTEYLQKRPVNRRWHICHYEYDYHYSNISGSGLWQDGELKLCLVWHGPCNNEDMEKLYVPMSYVLGKKSFEEWTTQYENEQLACQEKQEQDRKQLLENLRLENIHRAIKTLKQEGYKIVPPKNPV